MESLILGGWTIHGLRNSLCQLLLIFSSGPVVLLLDGHHSHISLELIVTQSSNIHTLCLSPNTTQSYNHWMLESLEKNYEVED